jgi:hypothetical protein
MKNPITYKNIEIIYNEHEQASQLPVVMTALDFFVREQQENVDHYSEKLNGSASSIEDIQKWTEKVQLSKNRINKIKPLLEQMANNELITKHTL